MWDVSDVLESKYDEVESKDLTRKSKKMLLVLYCNWIRLHKGKKCRTWASVMNKFEYCR